MSDSVVYSLTDYSTDLYMYSLYHAVPHTPNRLGYIVSSGFSIPSQKMKRQKLSIILAHAIGLNVTGLFSKLVVPHWLLHV